MSALPSVDVDLYCDESIWNPYAHYRALRDLGPVVRLARHDVLAVSRFADVRDVLRRHDAFSSAQGVSVAPPSGRGSVGNTVTSDPPHHTRLRSVVREPIAPAALEAIAPSIREEADALVERLRARSTFDAMTDFARHLPVTIVSRLVGLPEDGREQMLPWASATFDALGPDNERSRAAMPQVAALREYCQHAGSMEALRPDSWAGRIWQAGHAGRIPLDRCPVVMRDYVSPSLDTTIMATGSLLWLFGSHPEQWERLRADPALLPSAINEAIRLESPIRGFARVATQDQVVGGAAVPGGSRVLVLYASANRDERRWHDPERFDIGREVHDHLGFGFGIHTCVGMHLARLEITALFEALLRQVRRIEVGTPVWARNNVIRGIESMPVTLG